MLKEWARKILKDEIKKIEVYKDDLERKDIEINDLNERLNQCAKYRDDYSGENMRLRDQLKECQSKIKELEEQNAILRQYYKLDEEPSQELKDKMYLDERIREMDKELTKYRTIAECAKTIIQPPVYVPIYANPYNGMYQPSITARLY